MFRSSIIAVALLTASLSVFAQQSSKGQKAKTDPSSPVPKTSSVSIDSVISMVQAGISEDVIIARLRKEDRAFDLAPDDMIRLKKAGVSDGVLKVMMDPKTEIRTVASSPTFSPQPPASPLI